MYYSGIEEQIRQEEEHIKAILEEDVDEDK